MKEPVLEELLDALNCNLPGTLGEGFDNVLISAILTLSKTHGFGRMLQVAKAVADLWDRPDHIEMYRHQRAKRMKLLQSVTLRPVEERLEPGDS